MGASRFIELSAEDIVEIFLKQRNTDLLSGKESNVLRISGGEPFLLPELILECLNVLKEKNLTEEVFIWTETNLEPFVEINGESFMGSDVNKGILNEISTFDNIAVHPCFHGLDEKEFKNITTRHEDISLDDQIKAIKMLVDANIDIYPTIGSNVCNPNNLNLLFKKLVDINKALPFKIALVNYNLSIYPTVSERVLASGRDVNLYPHSTNLKIWNELMINNYGIGYGVVPRNIANIMTEPLYENTVLASEYNSIDTELFLFKGSSRPNYHREMLEILVYPTNHIVEIVYDKKWIQDDLLVHLNLAANKYKGKIANIFYVDSITNGTCSILPMRRLKIISVEHDADLLKIKFELKEYITINSVKNSKEYSDLTIKILTDYFGDKLLPKEKSGFYSLLGETFFAKVDENKYMVSSFFSKKKIPAILSSDYLTYKNVIRSLVGCKNMYDSLFYKIDFSNLTQKEENGRTIYEIIAGSKFNIKLRYFIPGSKNLTEEDRKVQYKCNSSTIKPIGPDNIILSKYGENDLIFIVESVQRKEEVTLVFWNEKKNYKAPKIQLEIRVKPNNVKKAVISTIGAGLLAFVAIFTNLFTEALKDTTNLSKLWVSLSNSFIVLCSLGWGFGALLLIIGFILFWIFYLMESGVKFKFS